MISAFANTLGGSLINQIISYVYINCIAVCTGGIGTGD